MLIFLLESQSTLNRMQDYGYIVYHAPEKKKKRILQTNANKTPYFPANLGKISESTWEN